MAGSRLSMLAIAVLSALVFLCSTRTVAVAGVIERAPAKVLKAAGLPAVTVIAQDGAISAPATFPAGQVQIDFINESGRPAGAQIFRLNPGVTQDDIDAAAPRLRDEPELLDQLVSGVGGPLGVQPGLEEDVWVYLQPGDYVIQNSLDHFDHAYEFGNLPAFVPGMVSFPIYFASFHVDGPDAGGSAPAPTGEVDLLNFAFRLPQSFNAGQNELLVTNPSDQQHEMAIAKVADGHSIDDVVAFFQDQSQPKTQMDIVAQFPSPYLDGTGGLSSLAPGQTAVVNLDLTPGSYVMVCFIRDSETGLPHVGLGMIAGFNVP